MPINDLQLDIRTLAILEDSFVVGATYQDLANRSLPTSDLAKLPVLLLSPRSSSRLFVQQWCSARGFAVKPDIELGSIDPLVEFARLGYGATFIARSSVKEELRSGKLIELQLADELPPRSIGLAVRRYIKLSLAAEHFVRMLLTQSE